MTLTKINFITGNKNKLTEVRAILGSVIEVDNQAVDVPEIQGTIEEIAKEKARRAAEAVSLMCLLLQRACEPVVPKEVSLTAHALDQWAGVDGGYGAGIPRAEESPGASLGHEGLNKMLDGFDDRTAEAVCTFAFCRGPGEEPILFQGRTVLGSDEHAQGSIVRPRGPTNFGWDPIFEYEGQTYAEMEKEAKNRISHRYKALVKFQQWLAEGQQ
ncbi:uncharacterized protein N7482_004719 [Penicillium canariense]|uniref:XTP/dITP diphosphatase n=1 Tax=Penicillium canariense TaxID=189055 RepID=A0A9W9I748_9EURO|nr:uncharacterized protein N7482_004719 [Penicillium canariense]KAJ5169125.1 hypothetical protein N7482_004719 [Penicillium canariense]